MADVFVSYSRTDIAFARMLHQALKDNGFETWIDWQDIPPSAEWLSEVYEAIEKADTFVFLISQASVGSEICGLEVAHAAKNNKRLVPVVIGEVEPEQVAPELAALNWLFFRDEDDFSQVLRDLIHAIETDHAWVKEHTRLQVRALEWQRNDREGGYLLRGADLDRGEQWLARAPDKELEPTGLQAQYLLASRRAAIRRQRVTMGVVLTGLLIAIGLGALAWSQRNEAVTQGNMRATAQSDAEAASTRAVAEAWERATAQAVAVDESHMRATSEAEAETRASIARSRQLAIASTSQLDQDQELALLLAVEAAHEADTAEAADALRRALVHRGRTLRLLLGHGVEVYCAEWDPEGMRIVSAGADGTARVWDAVSGEERLVLRGHSDAVVEAVWDASGARIATAGVDGTVRVWDAETGVEQLSLKAHTEGVNALMWSPDGSNLITAGEDGRARVWHAVSGEELVVFSAHEEPIRHAAWNGDGSRIVSSSKTGARVWDAVTGQELAYLSPGGPYGTAVTFAAWAGDDARIVTGELGAASLWDLSAIDPSREEGIEPEELVVHTHSAPGAEIGAITHASWASDGGRLLSLSTNNTAEIWDADNGEGLTFLIGHTDAVRHGAWSPDDALVATGSDDGTARVWEAASGLEVARLTGHRGAVSHVAWDPPGARLVTASADGTVRVWALEAVDELAALDAGVQEFSTWSWEGNLLITGGYGSHVWNPETGEELCTLDGFAAWSPAGPELLTVGKDGTIHLWDTAESVSRGEQDAAPVTFPGSFGAWSPDGARVVTAVDDGTVHVWDAASGHELSVLSLSISDPNRVPWMLARQLVWSPDGARIATVDEEHTLQVWDADSGAILQELPGLADEVETVSWSPGGAHLVTVGKGDRAQTWDVTTGAQLGVLSGHGDRILYAAWSPDGSRIVTTGRDKTARVWEAVTGTELTVFSGHAGVVDYAAWNPDGTTIVTGGWDCRARIWDAATGRELAVIGGYFDAVRHAAWSPEGTRLAVTSWGGPARVFGVPLVNMEEAACARAVRNMSEREWATHMGTLPYRETCPGKPTLPGMNRLSDAGIGPRAGCP